MIDAETQSDLEAVLRRFDWGRIATYGEVVLVLKAGQAKLARVTTILKLD